MHETLAVSDASVGSRQRTAHAYILTTKCGKGVLKGSAPVDCDAEDIESTRAEMYGSLALHTLAGVLIDMFSVHSGELNSDALCKNTINTQQISFPRFFRPNIDIKLQIQQMRKSLYPIKILPTHLKGHQDDADDFILEEAPLEVRCNIEMDELSKAFLKNNQGPLEPVNESRPLLVQKAFLKVEGTLI